MASIELNDYLLSDANLQGYWRFEDTYNGVSFDPVTDWNNQNLLWYNADYHDLAMSFTVGSSGISVTKIGLMLNKVGSPTGNMSITIETDSGGSPSGTVVTNGTSGNVAESGLTGSNTYQNFTFGTAPSLSASTTYWIVLTTSRAESTTNYVKWMISNGSQVSGVGKRESNVPTWFTVGGDFYHQIYVSGVYSDDSGNSYDLDGCVAPSAAKFGNGIDLEDTNVQFAKHATPTNMRVTTSQSWVAWIKPETVNSTFRMIMSLNGTSNRWIRMRSDNKVEIHLDGPTPNGGTSTATLSAGNWYHVVGIYDSTVPEFRVFLNGVKTTTSISGSVTADSTGVIRIGVNSDESTQLLDGIIDDAAFFDRALNDSEVSYLYNGFLAKVINVT